MIFHTKGTNITDELETSIQLYRTEKYLPIYYNTPVQFMSRDLMSANNFFDFQTIIKIMMINNGDTPFFNHHTIIMY